MLYIVAKQMSDAELVSLFEFKQAQGDVKRYKKIGDITAVPAKPGVIVETYVDNKLETKSKPTEPGDMIATGVNGEEYVIKADKFKKLYRKNGSKWSPTGKVKGFIVTPEIGKFTFTAPWGELMHAEPGDLICTSNSDNYDVSKLYRVAESVVKTTFKLDV